VAQNLKILDQWRSFETTLLKKGSYVEPFRDAWNKNIFITKLTNLRSSSTADNQRTSAKSSCKIIQQAVDSAKVTNKEVM
jgi:hypothetical protein